MLKNVQEKPQYSEAEHKTGFQRCPEMIDTYFRLEFHMQTATHSSEFVTVGIYCQIGLKIKEILQ